MKSIKEIALKAKVSPGTVDRVIHNRGGVSEKTRIKIQKIIEDSNFVINPVASSLASKKEYKIATLIPKSNNSEFWKFPKEGILKSIDEVKSYGVTVNAFEFDQFSAASYIKAFEKLIQIRPNAVLIAPVFSKETRILVEQLNNLNIPYVFINIEIDGLKNLSFIGQSSYNGGYLAAKVMSLLTKPNTSISIIKIHKNIDNHNAIEQRIKGFTQFIKELKNPIAIQTLTINAIDDATEVNKKLTKHLIQYPNTKGMFVPSSKVSNVAFYIENIGLSMNLVGFDTTTKNISYLKKGVIDFLVSQKPFEQGYDGIKVLFNYLVHQKTPEPFYYSPIEIIVKENVEFM